MERYFINSTKFTIRTRNTKKGSVYDVVFRIVRTSGKMAQKSLCGYPTKGAAKKAYTEFVSKYCDALPANFEPRKKNVLFREAYVKYIKAKSCELKESSIVSIENAFRKHILPDLGNKEISEITKADAKIFIDGLCAKTQKNGKYYSRKYLMTVRGFINAFYIWLQERYDVQNPFDAAKVPKGTKQAEKGTKIKFWNREEFDRFLSVVDNDTYRAYFATLFFAGCRKMEACALTPADITDKTIHINKTISKKTRTKNTYNITPNKNAKDYVVPLCRPLKTILDDYKAKNYGKGSFFFGAEKPLAETSITRAFKEYTQRANLPEITVHGLRHSFVSLCIHHGANYMVVAALIADSPEQILHTYGHLWDSDRKAIIDSIE